MIERLNMTSKSYSGNTSFPANQNRGYFQIIMTSGTGTVEFGGGGGAIPLAADEKFSPRVCPTSSIDVATAGTFIVLSDKQV